MSQQKRQGPFRRLKVFVHPYQLKFNLSIILAILGVTSGLVPYFAVARMLVELLSGQTDFSFYLMWCAVAAAGYILRVIFANWSTSVSHQATYHVLRDMRKALVSKLSRLPMGTLLDTQSGQHMGIIVDRVESLETPLAHLLPEMTANILIPIAMLFYLLVLDWRMALVSLITIPLGMCFMSGVMKTYPKQYGASVQTSTRMNNAVVEYVNGIEVIKAFKQSSNSYQKYTDAVKDNAAFFYNWMKSVQWPMSAYTAVCPAVLLTVLPVGFLFYMGGSLTAPEFITIIILALSIVGPILAATNFTDDLARVGTVVDMVEGIMNAPELVRPDKPVKLNDLAIRLHNVSFAYHQDGVGNVLDGVNLTINSGTVTALVGPSGSGKSTITKLIAGFWDVTGGAISLGGVDVRKIPQRQLAEQIAYVSQDNYLFDDTVRENIRMGRKGATNAQVEQAAKDAGCDAFIRSLESGYDTRVGGAGGHLSGGERQRIAIARAMLKDAPIVILDEATAYIDPENEAVIQKAVGKLVAGKTLIVIAHRLSTITDSDQIVVINNGKVEGVGTQEELLHGCRLYQEMWQAHMGAKDGEEE